MKRTPTPRSTYTEIESFGLNPEELDQRVIGSYADFYLMVIGLIQGLATTFLVGAVIKTPAFDVLISSSALSEVTIEGKLFGFRFLLSLFLIVIVMYEYAYAIVMLRRYPRYADIVIPMLLGISECLSMYFIERSQAWWLFNAFASFFGICAWIYTLRVRKLNIRPKTVAGRRVRGQLLGNILMTFFALSVCMSAYITHRTSSMTVEWEIAHYVAFLLVGVALFIRGRRFLDKLRRDLVTDESLSSH